jgi:hypothetical protein
MQLLNNNTNEPTNPNMDSNLPDTAPISPISEQSAADKRSKDEQQDIIQKLLQEKQSERRKISKQVTLKDGDARDMSDYQLMSMRYKVYTLVLLVVGLGLWSWFVGPALNTYMADQTALNEAEATIATTSSQLEVAERLNTFAQSVEKDREPITVCVNTNEWCDELKTIFGAFNNDQDAALKQAQYYLQIGDLTDPKLIVDEKSILTNIDLFLLRYGANNKPQRTNQGEIQQIIIGDPALLQGKMYGVPIELVIRFPGDSTLINFLNNAENRIIANADIDLPPILYKVEEVGYDIASYEEIQDVTVKMIAYYYAE